MGPPPRQRLAPRDIRRPSYELSLSPIPGSVRGDVSEDEDRRSQKPSRIPRPFDPHQKSASRLGPNAVHGVHELGMQLARPTSSVYSGDRSSDAATVIVTDDPYRLNFQLDQHPLSNSHRRALSENDDMTSGTAPTAVLPAPQPSIPFLEEPVTVSFGRTPPETPSNRARQAAIAIDEKSGGTASSGETYDSLKNSRLQAQAVNARRLLYQSTNQRIADTKRPSGGQAGLPIVITSSASSPGKLSDLSASPHSPREPSPCPKIKEPSALGTHSRTVSDDRAPSRLGGRREDSGRPALVEHSEWRRLRSTTPDPMARLEASELQLDAVARQRQLTDSTAKAAAKRAEQEKERLRIRDEQRLWQDSLARVKRSIDVQRGQRSKDHSNLLASRPYENLGDTSLSSDAKVSEGKKERAEGKEDNDGAADKSRARRLLSKLKNSLRGKRAVTAFTKLRTGRETPTPELQWRDDTTKENICPMMQGQSPPPLPRPALPMGFRFVTHINQPPTLPRLGAEQLEASRPMRSLPNIRDQAHQQRQPRGQRPPLAMIPSVGDMETFDDEAKGPESPSEERRRRRDSTRARKGAV
ncbi:hypothetical protein RB598_007732 [Gaeumannomyces tritici]